MAAIRFSFLDLVRDADPNPGMLRLIPRDSVQPGSRAFALLAVELGLPGFLFGREPIATIELPSEPTLDDMLAAEILALRIAGRELPAGMRPFAQYAKFARDGLRPKEATGNLLPIESSLEGIFQAVRNALPEDQKDLHDPTHAERFLQNWKRIWDRIVAAAAEGVDPFTTPLFDDPEFARERAFLAHDRDKYRRDVARGDRWRVQFEGSTPQALALILRNPQSLLFKHWSREDKETLTGHPYELLAVQWGPGDWVISTDPFHNLSLAPLAAEFQAAEATNGSARALASPWFDGKPFAHSMIASPKGGSVLGDRQIVDVLRKWSKGRTALQPTARVPVIIGVAAAAVLACVALVVTYEWWPKPPLSRGSGVASEGVTPALHDADVASKPRVLVTVNDELLSRGLTRLDEDKSKPITSVEIDVLPKAGGNKVTFAIDQHVRQPVQLWVTVTTGQTKSDIKDVALEVNNEKLVAMPLMTGSPNEVRTDKHSVMLNAAQNPIGVHFVASGTSNTTIRLQWQADLAYKRDLLLLAVGVSGYGGEAHDLPCAVNDATELVKAFTRQAGENRLFRRILTNPELKVQCALNECATASKLRNELRWLKEKAETNPNSLAIVTLSGHGKTFDDDPEGTYYFLPHGYKKAEEIGNTALSWDDVLNYFKDFPCPVVIVLDTCHSGAATLRRNTNPSQELEEAIQHAMEKLTQSTNGIVVVAACRNGEGANESGTWGHGALTLSILELLEGKQRPVGKTKSSRARLETHPVLTLEDLRRYAEDRVADLVGEGQAVEVKATNGLFLRDIPIAASLDSNRPAASP